MGVEWEDLIGSSDIDLLERYGVRPGSILAGCFVGKMVCLHPNEAHNRICLQMAMKE